MPSSVISWKKIIKKKLRILCDRKKSFKSWQRSPSAKHFIAPAFKTVPYLVFIFSEQNKAKWEKDYFTFCLFFQNITQNDFPVTQKWVLLFASLKTCSVYRNFYSNKAIARKTKIWLDSGNCEKDYWNLSFHHHLHGSIICV